MQAIETKARDKLIIDAAGPPDGYCNVFIVEYNSGEFGIQVDGHIIKLMAVMGEVDVVYGFASPVRLINTRTFYGITKMQMDDIKKKARDVKRCFSDFTPKEFGPANSKAFARALARNICEEPPRGDTAFYVLSFILIACCALTSAYEYFFK